MTYPQTQLNESAITQELCVSTCLGQGYPFAGVEYGQFRTAAPPALRFIADPHDRLSVLLRRKHRSAAYRR